MRKIRILSLFLVVLMLAMPVLASCKKGGGKTASTAGEEVSSSRVTRPVSSNEDDKNTPPGYNIYANFNSNGIGEFVSNTYFTAVEKAETVGYDIVKETPTRLDLGWPKAGEAGTPATGATNALYVTRTGAESSTNTDASIDFRPKMIALQGEYAITFSIKVTDGTKADVSIMGRKSYSSKTHFNTFAKYSPSTGILTAAGQNVCKLEKNKWYDVDLIIDDEAKSYDVYVDGVKLLDGVEYENTVYPKRSEAEVNLFRITIPVGVTNTEFYLDNITAYSPATGMPFGGYDDKSTTYEKLSLPDVPLFDAATADWNTLLKITGKANAEKLNGYEGKTDGLALSEGFRYVKVNENTGEYSELSELWGGAIGAVDAESGEAKYLMLDGFAEGFHDASFMFDYDFMVRNKIRARTGREIKDTIEETFGGGDTSYYYDLTNYSTLKIEFFVPEETYSHPSFYRFMLYLGSGNRGGISYFTQNYNTNDPMFAGGGLCTVEINIASLGGNRNASLTTLEGISFKFSGWSNSLGGAKDDPVGTGPKDNDHPIAIKSIKLSGNIRVPVADPKEGMEGCTHRDEAGNDLLVLNADKTNLVEVDSTCSDFGYGAVKCALCDKTTPIQGDPEYLELPSGHSYYDENGYTAGEVVILPTCVTGGSTTAPCINCGIEAVLEETAPTGHDYITKVDEKSGWVRFECKNCGTNETTYFAEKPVECGTVVATLEEKGLVWWGADLDNDSMFPAGKKFSDSSYDVSSTKGGQSVQSVNGLQMIVRNTEAEILDNAGVDNVKTYLRLHDKGVGAHNYFNLYTNTQGYPEKDFVFEYTYRLGQKVNGAYISYNTQLIDRASDANAGQNLFYGVATHTAEGTVTFVNSDFVATMSETNFTQISLAFHLTDNTYDIYINGVMKAKDVVLNKNAAQNMPLYVCDEIRFAGCQNGTMSWTDIGSCYVYSSKFPIAILGMDVAGSNEFNGELIKVEEPINVKNDAADEAFTNVDVSLDESGDIRHNTNYIVSFDFAGSADNALKNATLLQFTNFNAYHETLKENVLTVDNDGDIIFYGQIIGNTAESMKVELVVDQYKNSIDVYVNGAKTASGLFVNPDFSKVDEGAVLKSIGFGSVNGGAYTVSNLMVVTGFYGM